MGTIAGRRCAMRSCAEEGSSFGRAIPGGRFTWTTACAPSRLQRRPPSGSLEQPSGRTPQRARAGANSTGWASRSSALREPLAVPHPLPFATALATANSASESGAPSLTEPRLAERLDVAFAVPVFLKPVRTILCARTRNCADRVALATILRNRHRDARVWIFADGAVLLASIVEAFWFFLRLARTKPSEGDAEPARC